ncbi:hypothetical protein E2C01_086126 [Portunus trituberculatus]|uniref:Uncharacterized protein n=1 Tax=Portunus trituberculatus TaxID=210409 RepID=A0A5B7J2Z2_PORTR|nr:hypothetical protein [Portunus trituberculatus]
MTTYNLHHLCNTNQRGNRYSYTDPETQRSVARPRAKRQATQSFFSVHQVPRKVPRAFIRGTNRSPE